MDIDGVSVKPGTPELDPPALPLPSIADALEYVYGGLRHMPPTTTLTSGSGGVQGCLSLLLHELSADELRQRVGKKKYALLHALYQQSTLLNLWFSLELQLVLSALTEAHIPVLVLKGADIGSTIYPRPELRHYGDVDLLVKPPDLPAVTAILEGQGYHYHQEYRFETISKERAAFLYVKEVSLGYLVFEVHISPHRNEFGISFDTAHIWNRARPITVAGVAVWGMGLEDLLLYLCWHYRSHAFQRLIWLYDIAVLLQRCSAHLDWAVVERLAQQQGLKATVYYCIQWCHLMFSVAPATGARLEQFEPPPLMQRLITRLVGTDVRVVLRRSAQRERKIMQRLLVDTFPALARVMMRTAIPSRTHLGRLYMERSRLPLRLYWVYYFLHPFLVIKAGVMQRLRSRS